MANNTSAMSEAIFCTDFSVDGNNEHLHKSAKCGQGHGFCGGDQKEVGVLDVASKTPRVAVL